MACLPGSTAVEGFDGTAATVGTGKTAVVLVNGAGESACAWQGLATKAVDAGHRVYAFEYASDGPPLGDRRAELQSIVEAAKGAGAERVVTVGGSRGGCLALTEAATNADISAVAVVSCATVWNREDRRHWRRTCPRSSSLSSKSSPPRTRTCRSPRSTSTRAGGPMPR